MTCDFKSLVWTKHCNFRWDFRVNRGMVEMPVLHKRDDSFKVVEQIKRFVLKNTKIMLYDNFFCFICTYENITFFMNYIYTFLFFIKCGNNKQKLNKKFYLYVKSRGMKRSICIVLYTSFWLY